ncbi:MAG: helix-turn-helix domain-containing protein [Crocinitomicaceae bacterium]
MEQNTDAQFNQIADFTERFINQTNRSIFLTGKAGTGKTTFLRHLVKTSHKQTVIVAPTGIAALNAGGVTIHSFFQLPFGAFIPEFGAGTASDSLKIESKSTLMHHFRMNAARRSMFRNLELLIIDEVSMLRADLLDAMDWTLRNVRKNNTPYGGVQVLFIGDLLQLPPVVKQQEWSHLNKYYNGMYFFHAQVISEMPPLYVELEKVYRQEDPEFLQILNNLRNNSITNEDIEILNQHLKPDFKPEEEEGYITLTTHNREADSINQRALDALDTKSRTFDAEVTGKFPEYLNPIEAKLELKIGAQVMFVKNDLSHEKLFYNGKMGRVVALDRDEIKVLFPEEKKTIKVELYEWENIKYTYNDSNGEMESETLGTFVQYPLRLAWAITVHKSQGLTFDKAVLDITNVFAPGQAYVALSRLRSLDGLVLLKPMRKNGLSTDAQIKEYAATKVAPDILDEQLEQSTAVYLYEELSQTFDWLEMVNAWQSHEKSYKEHGSKSQKGKNRSWVTQQVQQLSGTLDPARKFRNQLSSLFSKLPIDYQHTFERVEAAFNYFYKTLDGVLYSNLKKIAELQQKRSTKNYAEELLDLDLMLTESILRLKKSMALIQAVRDGKPLDKKVTQTPEIKNYKVAKIEMVKNELMASKSTLDFDTLTIDIQTKDQKKPEKKKKKSTYETTRELIKEGKTIEEIARERQLSVGTISTHCARLIQQEKVELHEVMDKEKRNALYDLFEDNYEGGSLSPLKDLAGDQFTWDELKLYQASLML